MAVYDNDNQTKRGAEEPEGSRGTSAPTVAEQSESNAVGSFYKGDGEEAKGGKGGIKAKIKGFAQKHKKLLWIGAPTAGFGLVGIMFLLFMLSTLLLPNFMEMAIARQFANTARSYRQANSQVLSKKVAVQSADTPAKLSFIDKAKKLKSAVLLEKWRPNAIVNNMKSSGDLSFEYTPRSNGALQTLYGSEMTAINIKDDKGVLQRIELKKLNRWGVPFASSGNQNVLTNVRLAKDVDEALSNALRTKGVASHVLRTAVGAEILNRLGYSKFYAWSNKGKSYDKLEEKEARRAFLRENRKIALGDGVKETPSLPANQKATEQARAADEEVFNDDGKTDKVVQSGEMADEVVKATVEGLEETKLQLATRVVSSVNAVAITACMIVDGSVESSGPLIDAKANASMRQTMHWASMADQQKSGDVTSKVIGLANERLNADGSVQRVMDAQADPEYIENPYAGPAGFSLINVAFGKAGADPSGWGADKVNGVLLPACKVVASTGFGLSSAAAELVVGFFTGGSTVAAEKVASQTLSRVVARYLQGYVSQLFTKRTATKLVVQGGAIGATTMLAKSIVSNYSNQYYNGAAKNAALGAQLEVGAAVLNNEEARVTGGRTLTFEEAEATASESKKQNAATQAALSPYERYLAVTNPQSLLSHTGYTMLGSFKTPIVANLLTSASKLFNPLAIMGLFSKLSPQVSAAGTQNATAFTGTVIGWSEEELNLVETRETYYDIFENERMLEASGKLEEIEEKYGKCRDDSFGTLFSTGAIARDENGLPVANRGDCSPENLGPHNQEGFGDNVFRWRIAARSTAAMTIGAELSEEQKKEN